MIQVGYGFSHAGLTYVFTMVVFPVIEPPDVFVVTPIDLAGEYVTRGWPSHKVVAFSYTVYVFTCLPPPIGSIVVERT